MNSVKRCIGLSVLFVADCLAEIKTLIFDLGKYIQYTKIVKILREQLTILIDDLEFNFELNEMIANDVIITSEI